MINYTWKVLNLYGKDTIESVRFYLSATDGRKYSKLPLYAEQE